MTPVTQTTRKPAITYVVHGHEDGIAKTRTVQASSISRAQAESRLQGPVVVHSGACPPEAGCR